MREKVVLYEFTKLLFSYSKTIKNQANNSIE